MIRCVKSVCVLNNSVGYTCVYVCIGDGLVCVVCV